MQKATRQISRYSKFGLYLAGIILILTSCIPKSQTVPTTTTSGPIPILAYYYIWFDTTSWDRAKVDFPLLGKYSSDDPAVMKQHIEWAKSAGITGFIVSWKGTDVLNRRLAQLVGIANQENFKLAIIYEGLDFNRNPLPVSQVDTDLDYFTSHYANNSAFNLFGKPMVIWSGTWKFSASDIQSVTQGRRDQLLILASEKDLAGYNRLASLVDGDAYYWSSVNPDTYTGYQTKLSTMAGAIHENGGLWIAPASPGFDARLIGGTTTVDRKNGDTLRTEMNTAYQSGPDAIGLISWNEFSENSYIEPSQKYGDQYLKVLANISHASGPNIANFDSSEPSGTLKYLSNGRIAALGLVALLILLGLLVIILRRMRQVHRNEP